MSVKGSADSDLSPTVVSELKLGSLFDGIGGFPLAAQRVGIQPVWASEIEPFPISVTKRHFPDMIHLGDVRQINGAEVEPVDVITFGSPCFPTGTLVITVKGYVPIEKVKPGDRVLTHTGKWQRVIRVGERIADTIILKGFGHPGIEVTHEHPFYASTKERRWNSEHRDYDSFMSEPKWVPAEKMQGLFWATPLKTDPLPIPVVPKAIDHRAAAPPVMDDHFWWFVGYWLGNGWVRDGQRPNRPVGQTWGQIFVCTGHEKADELEKRLRRTGMTWTRLEERTAIKFRTGNQALASWLVDNFGHYAHGKTLPAWVLSLPQKYRQALLDGVTAANGWRRSDGTVSITTVSKPLALGIRLLAESLGYASPMYTVNVAPTKEIEGRTVKQKPQFTVRYAQMRPHSSHRVAYGHSWGKVRMVREGRKAVRVYNLEVEHDNSYVVENMVVHNCQDLSVAGKRAGLAGERSSLFMEAVRIISEMREATDGQYPTFAVWENVVGAFSSNRGRDFAAVLTSLVGAEVGVPAKGWTRAGVAFGPIGQAAWRTFDAQFWGVPQRRRRIFLVADFRGQRAGQILFEPYSLPGDFAEGQEERQGTAGITADGAGTGSQCWIAGTLMASGAGLSRPAGMASEIDFLVPQVSMCLTTGTGQRMDAESETLIPVSPVGCRNCHENVRAVHSVYAVRRLIPTECERLMGFPDGWTEGGSDSARYKALGNSVAIPVVEWIMGRIAEALRKQYGTVEVQHGRVGA